MRIAQFSALSSLVVHVISVRKILKSIRKLERSKQESHSDTESWLLHCIAVLFITATLLFPSLQSGHPSPHIHQRPPFAYIHNYYYNAFTFSLKKNSFLVVTIPYTFSTQYIPPFVVYMCIFKNLVEQKCGITIQFYHSYYALMGETRGAYRVLVGKP